MNKRLKVVILGCEHCHIRGNSDYLSAHDSIELTGIWGRESDYVAGVARKLGARVIDRLDAMEKADVAIITSDTRDHLMLLEACAGKVRAVHVDKPLGLDRADAEKVRAAAKPYGELFAVGFFARLSPLFLALEARIKSGEIGTLKHLSISFGHTGRLDGWLDGWPMFTDVDRFGYGSFGDIAAQALDIATRLAGELEAKACVLTRRADEEADVGGTAVASSSSGALIRILASAELTGPRFDIRADGERGSLWMRGRQMGKYDEVGDPVVLLEGEWSKASDGPAALISHMLGQAHAPYATADDGVYVNALLDRFMEIAT